MQNTKYRIGNTYISRTNPTHAVSTITTAAKEGNGGYICVSNMRTVILAQKDVKYNALMKESFMNWPDGTPLSWCGKFWGLKDVACTSGPKTFKTMLSSNDSGVKHFLLGDTEDVLKAIIEKYQPLGANIVGTYSPPFAPLEEQDVDGMVNMIRDSGANIVWTALTAPKQDYLDKILSERMPSVLFIGVGRAFRLSIDMIKPAPVWAQKMGIGGMFIRRRKLYQTSWSYIKRTPILFSYILRILWRRLLGKKYSD